MHKISKRFGATVALDRVNLEVLPGEVHALVGENGAGKSTLMKILLGVYRPDAGEISLNGEPFQPETPLQARRSGVGMIYQELSLAPHLTVEENILLGMEPTRLGWVKWKEVRKKAVEVIEQFEHPEIKPDLPIHKLSISAQQLVEIGRSLALGCKLLVFDEPTSSLTRHDTAKLFSIIKGLKEKGISIVYISHFLEEVELLADRLTILRDGSVTGTHEIGSVTHDQIVQSMVGRKVNDLYPRTERSRGEPVLKVQELQRKGRTQKVNLTLHRGEVLGIFGLIGAGRTELLRSIFGLDPIRRGEISVATYFGEKTGPASPHKRWRQGVGIMSEDRQGEGLAPDLSVADNITLTKLKRFVSPTKQKATTQHWIESLGIRCQGPEQKVTNLSGGNQQKIAMARLLEHDVDLLLLDEPTKGIDVAAKAKIYQLIDQAAAGSVSERRKPKGILMVSSYLPELLGVCDRIAVMCRDRLSEARPVSELDEHSLMLSAIGKDS